MDEIGVKDFESDTWNAISAPPKTPAAIVNKINAAINEALKDPEIVARFKSSTWTPAAARPPTCGIR